MESNKSAALASSLTGIICDVASGARLANTGRGLPRPIDSGDGTGRLTPWQGGAVNLWTVGGPDPRLTAPARSLGTSGENPHAFPPPSPQVGGCPQASRHPAAKTG